MKFDARINEDDVKFVDATLDEGKRQERIERLSRSRRKLYIALSIEVVCVALVTLVDFMARYTSERSDGDSSSVMLTWVIFLLAFAIYLYTDLQIKFLKAGAVGSA